MGGTIEASSPKALASVQPSVITLLIENPGKGKNWGPLLRCCAAFGIETIYVVGYDQCDVRGSHGASKHVRLEAFPTHEQAAKALQGPLDNSNGGGFELLGLLPSPLGLNEDDDVGVFDRDQKVIREQFFYEPSEKELELVRIPAIESGNKSENVGTENNEKADSWNHISFPVHNRKKFPRRTCLVVDKLKRGLPWALAKHCSSFIHIPHANSNPSGSMLTLEASVSIVFHEAMNAGLVGHTTKNCMDANTDSSFTTSNYEGQKYHVEKVHKGGNPSDTETRQRKRKEREEKLKELQDEADDVEQHRSMLFGDNSNEGDY